VTSSERQKESPHRQLDALRNLVSAQESLDRAARRLAGIRQQALEAVLAADAGGGEAGRR
jgi:hypothetical protein